MDNAADEADIARRRDKRSRDEITRDTVIRTLMSMKEGRRYMWLRLEKCKIFSQTFDSGPGGFGKMAFAEGQRALGLEDLADIMRVASAEYLLMTQENSKKELPDD